MNYTLPVKQPVCFNRCILVGITLLVSSIANTLTAQQYFTAENTFAVKLGTTKPLYDRVSALPTDSSKLRERKANKPRIIPNFAGRRQMLTHNPEALPTGHDPLFNPAHSRMPMNDILPIINIEGIGEAASGSAPPDVNGDIGRDFYVEIVNATFFRVFDKAGIPVSGLISANSIWSQVQQTSAGDPILLYDQAVDRWFLTEFPSNNRVLIAISHTSDPRGSWDAYAFQTPRFPDFPKYGIWGDAYYLTTNEGGSNFPIYAINREDILAGVETARIQRLTVPKIGGISFEVGQPVDWDGLVAPPAGSPGIVVKLNDDDWGTTTTDEIVFHKINIDWDNSANSNIEQLSIPTAPYDTDGCQQENTGGFSCIPQPNGQGIDGAEWIICNKAQYRNFGTHEAFVMAFMVDVTGEDVAGIRWIEFRKTSMEDWHIFQEGTVGSDDGIHRFMPSIALDGQGGIGLGYAVSGPDKHPSLRYTGRYAGDPTGVMTFTEYEFATGSGSQGFDRFGDYFSMSVDPADESTFWFVGQYLPADNTWATRIVAFAASRDTIDVFPLSLLSPANDATLGAQSLSVSVFNRGLTTVFDFPIGYQFNNGAWITEIADIDSLPIDEELTFTFATPFDIQAAGTYPLRIATFLDNDGNKRNDTLTFMVTKFGLRDVALEYVVEGNVGVVCSEETEISLLVKNTGLDTVKHFVYTVLYAGTPVDTLTWIGSLPFGEETTVVFSAGISEGENQFSINVDTVNYIYTDEVPSNNQPAWLLTAHPSGQNVFLNFTTDNFPEETTWELFDHENNIIASAGPFAEQQNTYTFQFCLDPEECYTFTIYDAFGDGMSAQGVKGDYEIYNESAVLIADLPKANFGSQSNNQFCLTDQCLFALQVGVVHESAPGTGDGIALVDASNSLGEVTYSINNGTTFQTGNSFLNLVPGMYTLIAKDDAGCQDTTVFEILSCNLQTLITTEPAIGGDVGEIHVTSSGGIGTVTYSIQEGVFVQDSFFTNLEPGDYIVTVKDSVGCTSTDTVTVSTMVSTSFITAAYFIQVSPNPGKGVFQINARFESDNVFLPYTLFTDTGIPLFEGTIVSYDDWYRGEISLTAYPVGIYYITFRSGRDLAVSRLIKVD
ncbi:MAG: hypothetical protein SH808_09865 [Saprospiraceae bacterium]|nr:hypothetical protein [Saprospiraceae bacterium]